VDPVLAAPCGSCLFSSQETFWAQVPHDLQTSSECTTYFLQTSLIFRHVSLPYRKPRNQVQGLHLGGYRKIRIIDPRSELLSGDEEQLKGRLSILIAGQRCSLHLHTLACHFQPTPYALCG
jgi:hypothetical protein